MLKTIRHRYYTPAFFPFRAAKVSGGDAHSVAKPPAFTRNNSDNVEAATWDAIRADRSLTRGTNLLRAAGRALGLHVGSLNGY